MKTATRAKMFIAVSITCLIAASVVFLAGTPGLKRPAPPTKEVKMDKAEVSIDGFRFSNTEKDKGNWDVVAKRADIRKDTGVARLKDLQAVFTGENGSVLSLESGEGTFNTNSKDVELFPEDKNIKITSSSGYVMHAENLNWDNDKKELRTEDKVTLCGKNIKIEGKGLVARSDLQEVKITNGVKTVFTQSH
jgi:LPS export ABC transporter protein LptC